MNYYAYMSTKFFINKSRVNHPRDISVSIGPGQVYKHQVMLYNLKACKTGNGTRAEENE